MSYLTCPTPSTLCFEGGEVAVINRIRGWNRRIGGKGAAP